MPSADSLIQRIASGLLQSGREPARAGDGSSSIWAQAASVYGKKPDRDENTPATGFDPAAAILFEALVEAAFLVAYADGVFDDEERAVFAQIVLAAAHGSVSPTQIEALVSDLDARLMSEGPDHRLQSVCGRVGRAEHRGEVLRVAALVAQVSGGVSDPERQVMDKLAAALGLESSQVEEALATARDVLGG